MRFIADWARVTGGTVVIALQAPTPEVVAVFDNVLVLSDGFCLYSGPPSGLSSYFTARGFVCPDFMDIADYTLSLAVSPSYVNQSFPSPPGSTSATLLTREELAEEWRATVVKSLKSSTSSATSNNNNITGGVILSSPQDIAQYAKGVAHSTFYHMQLLVSRQSKIVLRNPAVSFGRVFQFIILGALFGSVYYKLKLDDFITKISLAMFAASTVSFASFAEIPAIFVGKKNAAKQLDGAFYPPSAFVLSVIVNSLPAALLSTFIFSTILYWMIGYADDAGRFFFFVLALIGHEQATSALFRFYAFALGSEELCQAAAGISTGSLLIFGGFYIAYPNIPPYMWPIYYISPFSWTVRSIVNSEFTADVYGSIKSDAYINAFGFFKGLDWKWGGIAMCFAYSLLLGPILSSLAVKYIRVRETPGSQRISEEIFLKAAAASALAVSASTSNLQSTAPTTASASTATTTIPPSIFPFTPAALSFSNIKYSVTLTDKNKTQKQLLAGISGTAEPGTMTALMGASGAGKTTLLDVLAFRKTTGIVTGEIAINGVPSLNGSDFARIAAFAEQEDVHADFTTVREAVTLSADLRLPASVPTSSRALFVSEVLTLLELVPIAERRTGSLSLGERKRLTIGVELASNPAILFLDEPTTGLDSRAAAVVVRVIRNVAKSGRTVIATIHQPSAEVFFGFDNLILLTQGGHCAYVGPLGEHSISLVSFLESIPFVPALRKGTNPANWMLEVLSGASANSDVDSSETSSVAIVPVAAVADTEAPSPKPDVRHAYVDSILSRNVIDKINVLTKNGVGAKIIVPAERSGFLTQCSLLLTRMSSYMWRNTLWNGLRIFVFTFLAIFFGLLYLKVKDSDQAGAFSKMACAFNGILFVSIITINTGIPNYARLRSVFYRERAAGFYSALAYPLALSLAEIPWTLFFVALFQSINYFMVGFKETSGPFFTAYLSAAITSWWFAVLGMGMIAFFPIPLLANIAGGPLIQFSILFGGINISVNVLPEGWKWFYYCNGFSHALRLFFLPQYEGDNTLVPINGGTSFITKESFAEYQLGLASKDKWQALGALSLIVLVAWVLMVTFYVKINHQKR